MRPSCYLNAVEIGDGNALLYNGFSLCIDVVPSEIARRLASSGAGEDLSFLRPAERKHLVRRGHLTGLTVDGEQEKMRKLAHALAQRERESDRQPLFGKMITFILTYRCNLSCSYCYQAEVRKTAGSSSMSEAFVDDLIRNHLDGLLPGDGENNRYFQLYGGEPLLPGNRGAIERILGYAKVHGISVSTVTNAVLLPKMLDLIGPEKGKINIVQVTLDGEQMVHDQQRVSRSGTPTFAQTILAIRELMKARANVIIRIHVHPGRIESARALVGYLERERILGHDGVKVYFWSTEDLHSQAIPPHEFERFARLFQDVARKQNSLPTAHFSFLEQIMDMESAESLPMRNHCSICVSGLHCVVDPLGDIYECIDDAGRKDRRIGTLSAGKIEYLKRSEAHVKPYLRDNPECLKCSVALYCGGGCTNRSKSRNASASAPFCLQIKEFIGLTLRSCYLLRRDRASPKSMDDDGLAEGGDGKTTMGALIETIQHHLTPDLLPLQYRESNRVNPLFGHCYHSVEALYHLIRDLQLPREYLRFRLRRGVDAGKIPHWWLQNDQGAILDPTAGQYTSKGLIPPYANGRFRSFLTKQPSENARFLMGRVKQSV
jgi:uncharacterized protein